MEKEKNREKDNLEEGIGAWFNNTLENKEKIKYEYFDINKYMNILCEDSSVKECFDLHLKDTWRELGKKLNNYTHGNGKAYIMDNAYHCTKNDDMQNKLGGVGDSIWQITACFLSILYLIKPNSIMSSDLLDYLDCGLTPPENAQQLIAPVFQNYIDTYITRISPQLKKYLTDNNPYEMMIE